MRVMYCSMPQHWGGKTLTATYLKSMDLCQVYSYVNGIWDPAELPSLILVEIFLWLIYCSINCW